MPFKHVLINKLPDPSSDFPAEWLVEFRDEIRNRALRRVEVITQTLLLIEGLLLVYDLFRTQGLVKGADQVFVWRITFLGFLLAYRVFLSHAVKNDFRLRIFLVCGTFFTSWASVVLAGISGDMSTYTIGVLAIAAICPLPGRFNALLFVISSISLIATLIGLFPSQGGFWIVNIIATCVLGIVIERLAFDSAMTSFTNRKGIERQRERVDELLYNVFPQTIASSLKEGRRSIAMHGEVTIVFADVVGFTKLASKLLPSQLIEVLEGLFGRFDQLAAKHGVEKIKTIGDAYMAISGAPTAVERQVERVADFALDIVATCTAYARESGLDLAMRVGIHTGPVVAGVIGSSRLCYDLWGDSVNTAQRMESVGNANTICVSEPVYFRLRKEYELEGRGLTEIKGKGEMETYVLKGRLSPSPAD